MREAEIEKDYYVTEDIDNFFEVLRSNKKIFIFSYNYFERKLLLPSKFRKERLTRRQLHVLPFLISNPNVELAAKQSGVSAKQIFDLLNQSAFRQELENKKNEAVNQAVDLLKVTASKACDTLIGLLENAESESVRHRVAVDMLNMTKKSEFVKAIASNAKPSWGN